MIKRRRTRADGQAGKRASEAWAIMRIKDKAALGPGLGREQIAKAK